MRCSSPRFFGRDGETVHRCREYQGPHVDLILVVRIVQHAIERDFLDLGDGGDIAGHGAVDLDLLAALQHQQVADPERLATVADEKLRVAGDRALVDAKDAELADERVHHHLEHVRQNVLLGIGYGREFDRRRALAPGKKGRVALRRVGRELDQDVEQLGHAGAGARGDEANRQQMPFAQRFFERRMQLLGSDLPLLEVERHQGLVDLDDLVDQRGMRFGNRREIRFSGRVEKTVDDALAAVGGQIDRQAFLAEGCLDRRENLRWVHVLGVDLVNDDESTQLALPRPVHHARGDHLDACLRVDHDGGGLDRVERADRLTDEIGEAGGIDQVDPGAVDVEVHYRRAQRVLPRFLQRIEIADRGAALDAAGGRDGFAAEEQRLGKGRLAGGAVPDQCNGTNVFSGVLRHAYSW